MVSIYEAFIWWLTLWLPEHSDLAWMLDDASYDQRPYEFWECLSGYEKSVGVWAIANDRTTI